jgi:5-hydroxyisourate hydrolase-like protein (transthyretin family)
MSQITTHILDVSKGSPARGVAVTLECETTIGWEIIGRGETDEDGRLRDLLAPERLKNQGLFDADFVQKLIKEHETSAASHHKQLWTLLVFQLWFDNFLEK